MAKERDKIRIKEIEKREVWEKFFQNSEEKSFLQSYNWGNFQVSLGKKVWRLGFYQETFLKAACLLIKENFPRLKRGFFYVPFGPIFEKELSEGTKKEIINLLADWTRPLAKKEKVIFLRIEPLSPLPLASGARLAKRRIQPIQTWVLDLNKNEEEIFKGFTSRVRYNIGLAVRRGVKIKFLKGYHPDFYRLLKKTAKADKFHYFPERHYKNLFRFRGSGFEPIMCLAEYRDRVIASKILVFSGQTVTSIHGPADRAFRSLKAPTLAQWSAIKKAKEKAYRYYDFWGFDLKRWPGFSYFKKSFGGRVIRYPRGIEISFSRLWYFVYSLLATLKNLCKK